jgi:peptidoglycan/LPS O-acetylase OafA/YrhL
MRTGGQRTGRSSRLGFDLLRLLAIAFVAVQHVTSISETELPDLLGCLNLGQLGVTMLCGVSGFFAVRSSDANNLYWLARRLNRVYPPYWVALTAVLLANAFTGYKPISLSLIVAQFAGVAYFTHGGEILGVHFWFISLILLCYALALLLRYAPRLTVPTLLVAVAIVPLRPWPWAHVLSFVCGIILARAARPHPLGWGLVVIFGLAAGLVHPAFAYPAAASLSVLAGDHSRAISPPAVAAMAEATYEFFLVHGPIYLALSRFGHLGVFANLIFGSVCSVAAADLLRRIVRGIKVEGLHKLLRRGTAPVGASRQTSGVLQPEAQKG